tara:strand:+ start:1411 stop:1782 length:372 start_codon:yes stop_codon:yes gene_type:complete
MGSTVEISFRIPSCYKDFDIGYKVKLDPETVNEYGSLSLVENKTIPKFPIIILEKNMSQHEFFENGFSEWVNPELNDYRQTLENTIIPKYIEKTIGTKKYINVYNDGDDVIINYSLQIGNNIM